MLFKLSEITEPEYFSREDEFRDFIEKIVYAILDDLKERNIITNYRILRDFGFDLAIFIDKNGLPVVFSVGRRCTWFSARLPRVLPRRAGRCR